MYDIGVGHTSTGQKFSPLKYLYQKGVHHLDALVLTHPHGDHVDGIDDLRLFSIGMLTCARQISREEILAGNSDSANEWVDAYLALDRNYSTPVVDAESVYNPQNNGGVKILTFGQRDDETNTFAEESDRTFATLTFPPSSYSAYLSPCAAFFGATLYPSNFNHSRSTTSFSLAAYATVWNPSAIKTTCEIRS